VFISGPESSSWFERVLKVLSVQNKYNLNKVESLFSADLVLVFDQTVRTWLPLFFARALRKFQGSRRKQIFVLFRDEPRVVMPLNYGIWAMGYDLVFSPGILSKEGTSFDLHWPVNSLGVPEHSGAHTRSGVCMISANKLSTIEGELYTLRKRVARELREIHLYGRGWSKPTRDKIVELLKALVLSLSSGIPRARSALEWLRISPPCLGEVTNKLSILSRYRASVVIENSQDYVSEKIFDAIAGGTIPIYVGPDLSKFRALEGLYIQSDPSVKGIRAAIEISHQVDLAAFHKLSVNFLESDSYENFSPEAVTRLFLKQTLSRF